DERHLAAALDHQVEVVVDTQLAVTLAGTAQLEHVAAAARRLRETEVDGAEALGRLEPLDLVELLDAALHQRRLGSLVAKAADERLDALDLLLLQTIGLRLAGDALL